jgi:ABC-2 type transport system permease protein
MIPAIQSAWVTLRRRSVLLTAFGGSIAAALLATAVTITSATEQPSAAVGPGPATPTIGQLAASDGIVHGLANGLTFLGIVAVSLGALAFASDFQHGTIRTLLVREPNRLRFLAGKGLALAGLLAAGAAMATVAGAALALAIAPGQGIDTSAWSAGAVLEGWLDVAVAMIGYGALGAGLGLLMRSTVAAVSIGIGWTLAVEQLLTAAWDGASDVLPGQLLSALGDGSITAAGAATLALWLAALSGTATWTFVRRDVRI